MASPYELVLGKRLDDLHPRLRAYFGAIPEGSVGRGHGVFETVGSPRRWLRLVLALLGLDGIAFPVWQHDVPFDVENRPVRRPDGSVAVAAVRTFHFDDGPRRMVDQIAAEAEGLVDHLGRHGLLHAVLDAAVRGGALELRSRAVKAGPWRGAAQFLRPFAPRVVLTERFDDAADRQRVSIVLTMPVIGRIYEYAGTFTYAVVEDDAGTTTTQTAARGQGAAT